MGISVGGEGPLYKEMVKELRTYGLSNGSCICQHMGIMDEAADAIETLLSENEKIGKVEAERDAAISDMEKVMTISSASVCVYCIATECYGRGGYRFCEPIWRGRERKAESGNE